MAHETLATLAAAPATRPGRRRSTGRARPSEAAAATARSDPSPAPHAHPGAAGRDPRHTQEPPERERPAVREGART